MNKNIAKLTRQELRHAKFDGVFITDAENLAEWMSEEWETGYPKFTRNQITTMKDVEFIAHLLLLIDEGVKGYIQDELDEAFSNRDDEWETGEEVVKSFKDTVTKINEFINGASNNLKNTRLKNQADFYGLFGVFCELDDVNDYENLETNLETFFNIVDDENEREKNEDALKYYETVRSNTLKGPVRAERISILKKILLGES